MLDPGTILKKAHHSKFYLRLLNWSLNRMIPFNQPHGFKILEISDQKIKTMLPYRKKNLNHIRGLHACALATLTEFTAGFFLYSKLNMQHYRLILAHIHMDYHFQGKMDAVAEFSFTEEQMEKEVKEVLKTDEVVKIQCEVKIHDVQGNHLTTGVTEWQIKNWRSVKTKA